MGYVVNLLAALGLFTRALFTPSGVTIRILVGPLR